ncbi:MAG: metal-dependent hydrolase [Methanospirillum sp.]
MFILFHLLVGILLGYLLADRLGTRAVVLPCMIGALLPDLVDKPLGILVLGGSLGSGRIFLHTLLFLVVLLLAGAVAYRRYGPALLAVGVGVASHQVLDAMWAEPKAWLFPLLGFSAPMTNTEGWFVRMFFAELANPLEWVSAAALLVLLLPVLWPAGTSAFTARFGRLLRPLALAAAVLVAALGLLVVGGGAFRRFTPGAGALGDAVLWYALMGGAVLLLTAYALYRLAARLSGDAVSIGLK